MMKILPKLLALILDLPRSNSQTSSYLKTLLLAGFFLEISLKGISYFMPQLLYILAAFLLIFLNGFFVAAEFGLVRMRGSRVQILKTSHGFQGVIVGKIHNQLDAYLSACQLGITLTSLGLGWIGEPAFAVVIEPIVSYFGKFSPATIKTISFITAFITISYLHIVLGELAPKSIAIRRPQTVSLWTAFPLYIFYWGTYPFIWLLNKSANFFIRGLRLENNQDSEHFYSTEELKIILHSSQRHGDLKIEEKEILDNVLEFTELMVADIMRPLEELIFLSLDEPMSRNYEIIAAHRFSRYPVYERHDDPQSILGIIHVKDILLAKENEIDVDYLKNALRPITRVETELSALKILQRFRTGQSHFAIVTHYIHGTIVGFITLENLLNTLLGQIRDEFTSTHLDWSYGKKGTLLMRANAPVYLLEKLLDISLDETEAHTISGLIMTHLERMPREKERISFPDFDIVVRKIKGPRIISVRVIPKKNDRQNPID
jgi:CBS domain containing-hemolysin-like protein